MSAERNERLIRRAIQDAPFALSKSIDEIIDDITIDVPDSLRVAVGAESLFGTSYILMFSDKAMYYWNEYNRVDSIPLSDIDSVKIQADKFYIRLKSNHPEIGPFKDGEHLEPAWQELYSASRDNR